MSGLIRLGRSDDLSILRQIEQAAGERFRDFGLDHVADDEPASIETLQSYVDADRVWVAADEADMPIGYILVDDVDGAPHIEQVSVLPDYQGNGLGRALMDQVCRWAVEQGRSGVTLTTFDHIPWNRPLYAHLGFRVVSDEEIGPGLRSVREAESAHGLDPAMRVVMRLDLPAPSDGVD
jgi:GNAT superfamily N-acetyltransferase